MNWETEREFGMHGDQRVRTKKSSCLFWEGHIRLGLFSEEKGGALRVAIIRFASIPEYCEHGVENGLEGETQIDAGCPLESYCPQLGRNWPRMNSNRGKNNCFSIHSHQYCMQLN